jgi:LacI family transcriptional regulator/LacI family repressor for deo operon, udp, cdd, tsx, nupC, and nupG
MKKRVTLKVIAEATGFHVTTVSGVLRGKPHFDPATVEAIRAAAKRLDYTPDPMLAALASYRSGLKSPLAGNTIACVGLGPMESIRDWGFDLVLPGIQNAARLYGFSVDLFNASEKNMGFARLGKILHARGIKGVIFAPGPEPDMKIPDDFPFERFSSVAIEDCIVQPASIHRVMNHRSRNVSLAVEHCIQAGRKRIGLATFEDRERRQHRAETGSFLAAMIHNGLSADIPVFAPKKLLKKELLAWWHRYQPDAVLCSNHKLVDCLMGAQSVGVPKKTALVHYHIVAGAEPYAGVLTQHAHIGVKAVDIVVAMINRGEVGLPESNIFVQVPGVWHPGCTLIEK